MADTQRKERFGLGGLFHSPSTQELSLRGFFFSDRKIAAVGLRTGAGAWIAPSRERIRRNDVVKAFPQCQNPLCGLEFSIPGVADPAELQPLSFVARRVDKSEYVIRIESPVTVVEVDGSIDHVSANIVSHHIRISGTLPNNGAAQLQSLRLGGFMLMDLASKADRASRRFTAEASLRTPVRQPNSETAKAELYQTTPRPGQVLEAVFRPTKGNHLINIRRELTGAEVQTAVVVLSKARVSGANGLVEFSGGFFGDFPAGRVQLEANGKTLPRNARLDPHYEGFPKALPGVMDSAFSGWRWCGEAPATELTSARLGVRLQNGSHEVAVIDCVLEPDLIEFTNEPLEPAFFISPFQEQFDALLAAAQPSDMPIVAMVFPGDLFATFAGGPTRVLEMSRYLHSMGFAIGLIDMPLSFEETSEIPEAFREFIAWRAPLPKKNLQDLAHLGLDYLQSETGREPLQRALEAALDQVDKMPGEVIERRTNPAFNALAALLISKVKADFAISHFVWTAPVLELLGPETVKILDIHDIQHLRGSLHRQWTGQDDYQADEALELELWKKADYVLAI